MPQPVSSRLLLVWPLAALLAAGCAKPQVVARAEPAPPPPLSMPVPPPRIVVPPQPAPPAPVEMDPVEPVRPRNSRPAPRTEPRANVPPVEEMPAERAKAEPPAQSLELKYRDGPDEGAIRAQLTRAEADLNQVKYADLSTDLKAQYETARRFITLGGQALKEQNVVFAATLADKAGSIARLLLKR